jgi:hypothetical protein
MFVRDEWQLNTVDGALLPACVDRLSKFTSEGKISRVSRLYVSPVIIAANRGAVYLALSFRAGLRFVLCFASQALGA